MDNQSLIRLKEIKDGELITMQSRLKRVTNGINTMKAEFTDFKNDYIESIYLPIL